MRHLSVVLLCFAVGCGATNPNHGGGGSGGTGGGGSGGTGGGGSGGTGGGGTGGSGGGGDGSNCSDAAKLIYVIDQDGTFSSFKPDQMTIANSVFTDLGKLNCSGASGFYEPFSMSVDRNAVAWVEFVDGSPPPLTPGPNKLFNVSTANAACTPTTFAGNQQGFDEFGMGFVSNTAMSTDETLFIGGGDMVGGTSNLGTLDVTSFMITKGNPLTGDPELTGTGLADLWGFFPVTGNNTMARVSQIDKTSAMETSQIQLPTLTGQADDWAFGFYGGDFYVFLASGGKATIVYHVTQNGGTQPVDMLDTKSRHIVGAGVSTCAPTTPIG